MTIHIQALSFHAILGILDEERTHLQSITVDATIEYVYDGSLYLDYALIRQHIINHIQKQKFHLLEEAIKDTKTSLQSTFPDIQSIHLKITKPDIFEDCTIALSE